jgi:hypothetical protein
MKHTIDLRKNKNESIRPQLTAALVFMSFTMVSNLSEDFFTKRIRCTFSGPSKILDALYARGE